MPDEELDRFPRRPPRLDRLFPGVDPFYFVTFNTWNRRELLASPQVHETFRIFCAQAVTFGVSVGRYVIMPDHIHLFAALSGKDLSLPQWIKALRSVLGKTLIKMGTDKPHWQEGFFDHVLRNPRSYAEKWEYVRMNPVRKGLVTQREEWPFQGQIENISL